MSDKLVKKQRQIVAVLDNIRSLYNVGSIFRTSDAFGISNLYLCGLTGTPEDELERKRISKTALGAESTVPWSYSESTVEVINQLKKDGFTVLALEQTPSSVSLLEFINPSASELSISTPRTTNYEPRIHHRLALVVGHELFGVGESALQLADEVVHIPMTGTKESLNVSVAFGIAVFNLQIPTSQ